MKLQIKFSELNKQFRSIRNEVKYQNRVTRSCTNRVINSLTHLLSTFSSATYWFLEQTVVDQRQCRHSIVFSTNELFSNSNKSDGIYFCGGVNKKHINNVVKLMTSHSKCVLLFWVYVFNEHSLEIKFTIPATRMIIIEKNMIIFIEI